MWPAAVGLGGGATDGFALRLGPRRTPLYVPNGEEAWRHVRAVPCDPGGAVLLSHRVVHWGSAGRSAGAGAAAGPPRVSLSFAASDHAHEPPYFDPRHLRGGGGGGGGGGRNICSGLVHRVSRVSR